LQIRFSEYVPQGLYALYSIGIIGFFIFAELIF
jgi:hypothetical protein